jgi:hypothetical protein
MENIDTEIKNKNMENIDIEIAIKNYKEKNYVYSKYLFEHLSNEGDATAKYYLGIMYR